MKRSTVFLAAVLLLSGCVAPSDTKSASSEVTAALSELQSAERGFERELAGLIDDTLEQIESTMVTRAVDAKLQELAQNPGGNLIAISTQVPEERRRARSVMARLKSFKLKKGETGEAALARYRAAAQQALDAVAGGEDADLLAGVVTNADSLVLSGADDDVITYFELRQMRREFKSGLGGLRDAIKVLREAHGIIDGWIQTDVTVSGEKVADTLEKAWNKRQGLREGGE